jgi:hypothetical protein
MELSIIYWIVGIIYLICTAITSYGLISLKWAFGSTSQEWYIAAFQYVALAILGLLWPVLLVFVLYNRYMGS